MPENQIPAAQPEPEAAPGEFDFGKPTARIKRRSLKAKTGVATKSSNGAKPSANELETEASPLSSEKSAKPQPKETPEVKSDSKPAPATKAAESPTAPPRTLPATAAATPKTAPASVSASTATTSSQSKPATTPSPPTSPHGTRPATLYYSSYPRKEEPSTPMKTVSPAATAASSSTASSTARPAATASTSAPRPSGAVDYRANVERQSREQKSVGNLLSYIVYGFLVLFVLVVGLAGYGADVIFKQLHEQSATVSDLDSRYSAANKDLNAKLTATQDAQAQAQTQLARQQELIMKQQEDLNKLIAAATDNANALKQEKQARAQETASLRARVRDLEDRAPQKL